MDNRLRQLVKEYDEADLYYYMATEDKFDRYDYTEVDIRKLLETRESILEKLYETYGVTRNEWGDLYLPDGTPIPLED